MALAVSVAMCTHNGAAHIEEQLTSILAQSRVPDEIIVSDDASTDETVQTIRRVMASTGSLKGSPRLVVLQNATALGVRKNFEQALRACTSELVALCDQDDIWHPDRLAAAIAEFDRLPDLLMLHSDARLVDEAGEWMGHSLFEALGITEAERESIRTGHGFEGLLRRNLVTGATTMVRSALVSRAAPFPSPWVHDEWLAVIAAATGRLDFFDAMLIDYRQHGANQIGVRKLTGIGKIRRVLEPRNDRNAYLLERAEVLLARLEQLGDIVPPAILELARGKVTHQSARARLSTARYRRWIPVLREARSGRYSKFSRGNADIVRDLFQPAGDPDSVSSASVSRGA
jgi:glycosyltransferase involved in cell wall biosynthesis